MNNLAHTILLFTDKCVKLKLYFKEAVRQLWGVNYMTDTGFLVAFFIVIFLVIIFALVAVIGAVTSAVAGINDDEDEIEEEGI